MQKNMDKKDDGEIESVKLIGGILNKLTPENFDHLLSKCKKEIVVSQIGTLLIIAETFHSKVITQKPLVRLYCNFLMEISKTLVVGDTNLCDIVLELSWKKIDDQYKVHETFANRRKKIDKYFGRNKGDKGGDDEYFDEGDIEELKEEYNNWLEQLYGNYVLLTELFCENKQLFQYKRLHKVLLSLINKNCEWTWNIIYVVLIFHGVALQKYETKSLEIYLESIDELVDGIHYNKDITITNTKYKHIPLRIKYLLMDVQEHIETTNGSSIITSENRGFMNPRKLNEIHAEFCKENNMTQQQLRKLLSLTRIESSSKSNRKHNKKKQKIKLKTLKISNFKNSHHHHHNIIMRQHLILQIIIIIIIIKHQKLIYHHNIDGKIRMNQSHQLHQ